MLSTEKFLINVRKISPFASTHACTRWIIKSQILLNTPDGGGFQSLFSEACGLLKCFSLAVLIFSPMGDSFVLISSFDYLLILLVINVIDCTAVHAGRRICEHVFTF